MNTQVEELRILRIKEVTRLTGLSESTIYAMVEVGTFPKPIRLGKRSVGWRASDVYAWLQAPERRWDPRECK